VGVPPTASLINTVEDIKVAVEQGTPIIAYIEDKEGVPLPAYSYHWRLHDVTVVPVSSLLKHQVSEIGRSNRVT
jgi:hypothetical protein